MRLSLFRRRPLSFDEATGLGAAPVPTEMPLCRGLFLGACVAGLDMTLAAGHAHSMADPRWGGWICIVNASYSGGALRVVSELLEHEYAHLATTSRHDSVWLAAFQIRWPTAAPDMAILALDDEAVFEMGLHGYARDAHVRSRLIEGRLP